MSHTQTTVTRDRIEQIARQIAAKFHPQRIMLFGSHAYGEPGPDSDVDLLVIIETEGNPLHTAARISGEIDHPFAIDILVETPKYLAEALAENDLFETEVMTKGVVLYEAQDS